MLTNLFNSVFFPCILVPQFKTLFNLFDKCGLLLKLLRLPTVLYFYFSELQSLLGAQQFPTSTGRSTATRAHAPTVSPMHEGHAQIQHHAPCVPSTGTYLTRPGAMPTVSANNHQSPGDASIVTRTHIHRRTRWSRLVSL